MKREQYLHHRLQTLGALHEAVSAMRSLSAHHFRLCRQVLPESRAYRQQIEEALVDVGVNQPLHPSGPAGVLLVVSDMGLCGDYNTRLVQALLDHFHEQQAGPVYCIGRRPRGSLARHGMTPKKTYHAPASVDGLPQLLLQLAPDVLEDLEHRLISGLVVISARFKGAGHFSPETTWILPVRAERPARPLRATGYQSHRHLATVTVREYLFATLYELLLDALASEHGMRLLAAESARHWLEETRETIKRQLAASRREATTQEVLDVVAGSRRSGSCLKKT